MASDLWRTKAAKGALLALFVGSSYVALAQAAHAADAPQLEEIVVTARKQGAQKLQDVAASVQAIDSQAIQAKQIQGFDDYARTVPSLSSVNQGPGQTQLVMRGVTSGRTTHAQPQTESTTGLYIDDIPASSGAFNPDLALFDVERIEVLRGPQGTLYGAGAMAGAVRILTKQPQMGVTEGMLEASASTTDHGDPSYDLKGLANLPVTDNLAIRLSGYYDRAGGYIDNLYTGEKNYNEQKTYGGRLSARYTPTNDLTLSLNVLYQNMKADGRPNMFLPNDPIVAGSALPSEPHTITGDYQVIKFTPDPFLDKFWIVNGVAEYKLPFGTLTSSTSLLDRTSQNHLDDTYRTRLHFGPALVDGSPLLSPFVNDTKSTHVTNETRIASDTGGRLEWIAGIFLEDQVDKFVQNEITPGLDALAVSFGLPPAAGFGAQPNSEFDGAQSIRKQQAAVFGEATLNFTKQWSALIGLRAFHYRERFNLRYAGIANEGVTSRTDTTSENGVNPKFQINFKPTPDILTYVQAAKGFRLGGVNEPVPLSGFFGTNCARDLASRGLSSLPETYASDSLWNYEAGFKSRLLNRRLTFNAAVYDIKWKDFQTSVFLPCGFATVVNSGELTSKGVELEMSAAVTDELTVSMNGSYTDAKLTKAGLTFNAETGDRAPNVPQWNWSATADYRRRVGPGELSLIADVTYVGPSFSEFEHAPLVEKVPQSTTADVFVAYELGSWKASLFAKNVNNARVVTAVNTDRNTPVTYSVARPRTIGVDLKYRY